MSESQFKTPTRKVKVKETGAQVTINNDEFDEELHEDAGDRKALPPKRGAAASAPPAGKAANKAPPKPADDEDDGDDEDED